MKDMLGNEFRLGDLVAGNHFGYNDYLYLFQVIGFTKQKVELIVIDAGYYDERIVLKFPHQIVRVA